MAPPALRTMRLHRFLQPGRRGVAALEFALIAPILLLMLGGVGQLGLEVWARGVLANAVSQGAYYAMLTGAGVSQSAISTMVTKVSTLSGVAASASTPILSCLSGTPAALSTPPKATGAPPACSDGSTPQSGYCTCPDGTAPGYYTTITASYTSVSILPVFTGLGTPTVTESITVRLQ